MRKIMFITLIAAFACSTPALANDKKPTTEKTKAESNEKSSVQFFWKPKIRI